MGYEGTIPVKRDFGFPACRGCGMLVANEMEEAVMITGAHVVVFSKDAEADRRFFRDVLGFANVDAGNGWLIFALPPAEVAMHSAEHNNRAELYLMCDDLKAEIAALVNKEVVFEKPHIERWGVVTKIRLPGGGKLGLYQPSHRVAVRPRS